MAIRGALDRLFRVRELEEEQCGAAVEEAVVQMRRLENAVVAAQERIRRGRLLVAASAQSGDLLDRVAGVEETRSAGRAQENLSNRSRMQKRRWQFAATLYGQARGAAPGRGTS